MDTQATSPTLAPTLFQYNRGSIVMSGLSALAMYAYLSSNYGWRQGALFIVGLAAGIILYHAAFGFTAAWREVINTGRGAGLRAQMIMLGVTVLIFTPLIAQGELWGTGLRGSVAPINLAVICGAFMFGIGMQLGGGCASGTLFTAGGGNVRMLVTLAAFITGSVLGTWQWEMWQGVPGVAPFSLAAHYGTAWAIIISLSLFGAIWYASTRYEQQAPWRREERPGCRPRLLTPKRTLDTASRGASSRRGECLYTTIGWTPMGSYFSFRLMGRKGRRISRH